ncbi:cbb3-type cytochrome oxidase subunit 3 [Niveispirillum irakense]|uniref:cbb3-type cytochrome oxidase subunit 3 n=1 Tax=Niveispirillum irakense TaxID=34011 RepID=UPI0004129968|nr:cbb3-type cytochrome c oxidase subunit 3 [Niveispirillum irakense]
MEQLLPLLKQLWLVWFMLLFVGICVWAFRPGARSRFEQQSRIPLDDAPGPLPRQPRR